MFFSIAARDFSKSPCAIEQLAEMSPVRSSAIFFGNTLKWGDRLLDELLFGFRAEVGQTSGIQGNEATQVISDATPALVLRNLWKVAHQSTADLTRTHRQGQRRIQQRCILCLLRRVNFEVPTFLFASARLNE